MSSRMSGVLPCGLTPFASSVSTTASSSSARSAQRRPAPTSDFVKREGKGLSTDVLVENRIWRVNL
jgi:hypothetical protein